MSKKVVLITGASSGIGFELALEFGSNKYKVWATSRNVAKFGNLRKITKDRKIQIDFVKLDLANKSSIDRAVKRIIKKDKKIDVLINNAGYGMVGTVEETPINELRRVFETNFFGAYYLTQLVIPFMRKRKRGAVVNVGSVTGKFGFAGMSGYSSTQWAIEAFSESLYLELKNFGIKVILFELGVVKTNFKKNQFEVWKSLKTSAYKAVYLKYKKRKLFNFSLKPSVIAKQILDAVDDENPPLRQTAGTDAWFLIKMRNWLPERIVLRLIKP